MSNETKNNESKSARELVEKVKKAVRRWYATVSVRELSINRALVAEIEAFERMLLGKGVTS